jgi:Na+-driven multidrug efflux pump
LAQATTSIYLVYYFLKGKSGIKFHLKNLALKGDILIETFTVGSAAFVRQVGGSILAMVLNNSLGYYGGDLAISVYAAINRLLMFVFMPMFGIVQGMQPIIGFNYGAEQFNRVKQTIHLSVIVTTIVSIFGFFILMIFPKQMIMIFNQDQALIEMGVSAIRIVVLAIPVVGFQVVGSSLYQALGKALPSLILSSTRQILFLIPLIIILPLRFQLTGIWYAFPTADLLSFIITFIMVTKEMKLLSNAEMNVEYEV